MSRIICFHNHVQNNIYSNGINLHCMRASGSSASSNGASRPPWPTHVHTPRHAPCITTVRRDTTRDAANFAALRDFDSLAASHGAHASVFWRRPHVLPLHRGPWPLNGRSACRGAAGRGGPWAAPAVMRTSCKLLVVPHGIFQHRLGDDISSTAC